MERAAGTDLTGFFGDWVRSPGAPQLAILNADRSPDGLRLELSQGKTEFELDVPLRLHYAERQEDLVVRMDRGMQRIELDCETSGLAALELDPDYQLFRKLKPEEVMPTSALTRDGERLLIVLPDVDEAEIAEGYRTAQASFRRAVLGEDDDRQRGHEVIELRAAEITPDDLLGTSVLILGQAVHSPVLVAFLSGTRSPAHFDEGGFAVGDRRYAEAGQAIYFTVQHPEDHELGVTVYYGNSAEALSNARVLNFYPNSLLVFETPAGAETEDPSGMPRAKVLQREDFEFHERWEF